MKNKMKKISNIKVMLRLVLLVIPLAPVMILAILSGVLGHLAAWGISFCGYLAFKYNALHSMLVLLAVLGISRGFLKYIEQYCNHYIAFKTLAIIRDKVFGKLRTLCPAKLECKDKGELISIITADIELLEVFYAHTISPIVIAVIFVLTLSVVIGKTSLLIAVLFLIAHFMLGFVFPVIISKSSKDYGKKQRATAGNLSSVVLDSLRGLSETIQFADSKNRLKKIKERTNELLFVDEKMSNISASGKAISSSAITILTLVVILITKQLELTTSVNLGTSMFVLIVMLSSFGPTLALSALGSTLQPTLASGLRILNILDEKPQLEDVSDKEEISFSGLAAKDLSFAYAANTILKGINLKIPLNRTIGIVGKSGSGKSTLLRLFMRFWEVTSGAVEISERNINKINTSNLRNMESFVMQSTHIFKDSIFNNIRIAKLNASLEEVKESCKKASIHDFIMQLPNGYDTEIGELGGTISGGECQRIGVARAFLHNAPLLLLDEPTSNLDGLNEAIILKSLEMQSRDKTIVLVSHRKSSVRICDEVISIEDINAVKRMS